MRFLLNVIDFTSDPPTDDESDAIDAFLDELRAHGHWVSTEEFADPRLSTVIDGRGDTPLQEERRLAETAEWIVGFWIVEAPSLKAALELAAEGSKACNRRVEVRSLR